MAYSKDELIKKAVDNINRYNLYFMQDVIGMLPCSSSTFYNLELEKVEAIKEAIEEKKIATKINLRGKWYNSDNPTLQMGLYKLLADDEERKKLSMQYTDHTSGGEKITNFRVEVVNKPTDND